MKRKLLSFVVAFMLLLQTFASAGALFDYLQGIKAVNPTAFDASDRFSWTQFVDQNPAVNSPEDGGVVIAPITGAVKATVEADTSYASSTYASDFDYKLSIDMTNVKNTFNKLYTYATTALTSNPTALGMFDNSIIKGKFTVVVNYDAAINLPSGATVASLTLKQPTHTPEAEIFTINTTKSSVDGTNRIITIVIDANTTVGALNSDITKIGDLYVELPAWKDDTVHDAQISATMTGYTIIEEPAGYPSSKEYAIIDYQAPQSDVVVYKDTSSSHRPSGGGGGSSTIVTPPTDEPGVVQTPDSEVIEGSIVEENPDGTATITVSPGSQKGKGNKKPNGYGKTPYEPADPDYDPDEPQVFDDVDPDDDGNYTLYPRYVNTEVPSRLRRHKDGEEDFEHYAYIVGYPDGEVKPNGNITREEVTAAFYRLLNAEYRETIETTEHSFPDVNADRWSNASIATMANGGYIVGDTEGNFRPGTPITRAEFAVIASKFIDEDAEIDENFFTDIDGHWAKDYILKVAEEYWISGYENRTFKPDAYITRAEAMTIINRMLVRYGDVDSDYAIQWPDVDKSDWYYQSIIEATTDHKFERKANGWSEKWIER